MIARLRIWLPFALTIPEKEQYSVYAYELDGYRISTYPPTRSERADTYSDIDCIRIDNRNAYRADVLRIDFQKESFDRTEGHEIDPPRIFLQSVINDFLARLRFVTSASQVKPIEFPNLSWNLQYLSDDESELPEEKGKIRDGAARPLRASYLALTKEVWEDLHSLNPYYDPPVWNTLLLDAKSLLPEIGPAIVLAFTALEVFISRTLDQIVAPNTQHGALWAWVNGRGSLKDPSIEEKYDFLSRHIIGNTIKDNNELWEAFKHLRKARNSFVHDGIARVGNETVNIEKARYFIAKANEILDFLKAALPPEYRSPEFQHQANIQYSFKPIQFDSNSS